MMFVLVAGVGGRHPGSECRCRQHVTRRRTAQLEASGGKAKPAGRPVGDALDEWVKQNLDTWPSSARDQQSRVRSIKKDQIARLPLARLTVATHLLFEGLGA